RPPPTTPPQWRPPRSPVLPAISWLDLPLLAFPDRCLGLASRLGRLRRRTRLRRLLRLLEPLLQQLVTAVLEPVLDRDLAQPGQRLAAEDDVADGHVLVFLEELVAERDQLDVARRATLHRCLERRRLGLEPGAFGVLGACHRRRFGISRL